MATALDHKGFAPKADATPKRAIKLSPEGIVTAIVAVTGVVDAVNDLIVPGAFAASLKLRRPKVVDDHGWGNKAGRVLHVEEWMPGDARLPKLTKDGKPWPAEAGALVATMQYNLRSERGRESFEWVSFYHESNECEYSIGYKVPDGMAKKRRDGVRVILQVDLYEFSHVLFGAAPLTMTLEVKSMHGNSGGQITAPAITGADDDDEDYADAPTHSPDAPWDDDQPVTTRKQANMEAKTAAAVLVAAKTVEPELEVKDYSRMQGSYEETRVALEAALRDLFAATSDVPKEKVWVYLVATYPTEVIVCVDKCDGDPGVEYLVPYTLHDGLNVELGQPERVNLSLVAEPVAEATGHVDDDELTAEIVGAIMRPVVAATAYEGKAAELVLEAMRSLLEAKSATAPADEDLADPEGEDEAPAAPLEPMPDDAPLDVPPPVDVPTSGPPEDLIVAPEPDEADEDLAESLDDENATDEDDLEGKTEPKDELAEEVVTIDPDEHFSMLNDLESGLDSQLEDRNKNN